MLENEQLVICMGGKSNSRPNLLPDKIMLFICSDTACASGEFLFHAVLINSRSVQVRFDFPAVSAAYIHSLMSHLYRKYGLFAAYITYHSKEFLLSVSI